MNQPDARDLLATARELLLKQLLPALPASLHYEARMIASAMAIAAREMAQATACAQAEAQALARVLDIHGRAEPSPAEARAARACSTTCACSPASSCGSAIPRWWPMPEFPSRPLRRRRCYLVRHGHVSYFDAAGRPDRKSVV